MRDRLRVAMVQMRSTNAHEGNVETLVRRAAEAKDGGADLLALPEAGGMMNRDVADARTRITEEARDPWLAACREAARRHDLWVQTGSTPMKAEDDTRFVNRGHLVDPEGRIVARYDKIHLFDVTLPGQKPSRESDRYSPGEAAVVADTPWGGMGLTICYDVRFPHLFRDQAKRGVRVIFVPSAFAMKTGEAHWEILLRARAIENGCFVVASAQEGRHDDGRQTWGRSLIVDPWGRVLVDMGEGEGIAFADLDLAQVEATRAAIPSLANERPYRFEDAPVPAPEGVTP